MWQMESYMDIEDLKSLAGRACIDLYLSIHVIQLEGQTEQIKKAWSIGQELYLKTFGDT